MDKHILILSILGNPYQLVEGGFHKTVYELIEFFKETDIHITLITSNTTISEDIFQKKYSNINLVELALNPEWVAHQDQLFSNADYLIKKTKKIIDDCCNPISMIHSLQWINGYIAVKINSIYNLPHMHSIISSSFERKKSGFEPRTKYQRQCEDLVFKKADRLLSITQTEKNQLVNYYNIDESKILVIGRTVDYYYNYFYEIRHKQNTKEDKISYNNNKNISVSSWNQKAFVYIGRIIEYKGIQEIIMAWEKLYKRYQEDTPPFWIIGGKEKDIELFRNIIQKNISRLGHYEKIHKILWWGYMESYGISTIYQKSHVLLMHSAFEPGGRVVLEAMTSGKPIIGTFTGFANTYIKNWYNGFLVEYKNINMLSHYMEFYIKNEYLSNMMGINAKNTYNVLNNHWQYYEKMNNLYHLLDVNNNNNIDNLILKSKYPLLIDEFPYFDVKNDDTDLAEFTTIFTQQIEEIIIGNSYIWRIINDNGIFFAKQFYNRLNITQLWNMFDVQKVHSIWMQYHTSIFSTKYTCIISPLKSSEKIFTYILPIYTILPNDKVLDVYPAMLAKLQKYEKGVCKSFFTIFNEKKYFSNLNSNIQYKHKYFTIGIFLFELRDVFNNSSTLFKEYEIFILEKCFEKLQFYLQQNNEIIYGLNYGKNFWGHLISENNSLFLLPSSDIFIGELGYDECIIFSEYYLQNRSFLKKTFYPRKKILIWSLLFCIESFISHKILYKPTRIFLKDFIVLLDEISNEK